MVVRPLGIVGPGRLELHHFGHLGVDLVGGGVDAFHVQALSRLPIHAAAAGTLEILRVAAGTLEILRVAAGQGAG